MLPEAVPDATLLEALASPRRREILRLVWDTDMAAGEIHAAMPDVTFPAVSLHLAKLSRDGLLDMRAVGRQRRYRARREACAGVAPMLERMWDDALWRLKLQAELEHSRRGPRRRRRSGNKR